MKSERITGATLNQASHNLHHEINDAILFGKTKEGMRFNIAVDTDVIAVFMGIPVKNLIKARKEGLSFFISSGETPSEMQFEIIGPLTENLHLKTILTSPKERHKILHDWYDKACKAIQRDDRAFYSYTRDILERARILLGFVEIEGKKIQGMFDAQLKEDGIVNNCLARIKTILDNYLESEARDAVHHFGTISRDEGREILHIFWDLMNKNIPGITQTLKPTPADVLSATVDENVSPD